MKEEIPMLRTLLTSLLPCRGRIPLICAFKLTALPAILMAFPDPAVASYHLDPLFTRPQITVAAYPYRVIDDRRGGLLWVISGGRSDGVNGQRYGAVIRTSYDGIPDPAFKIGPVITDVGGLDVLPDKSILIAAAFAGDLFSSLVRNYHVFRFTTNGVLDSTFRSPVFDGPPWTVAVQADGRILVDNNGRNWQDSNGGISGLVRLNPDGSLDSSFQLASADGPTFPPILRDTQGNILFCGNFTSINGASRRGIARLLPDGTLDTSFNPSGFSSSNTTYVRGMVIQEGGKIAIAGRIRLPSSPYDRQIVLARLNPDGTLDTTFTPVSADASGLSWLPPRCMKELPDGKLLLSGLTLARFNPDGTPDPGFTVPAISSPADGAAVYWFETLPNGKVIVPASWPVSVDNLAFPEGSFCLNPDGSLDRTWTAPAFHAQAWGNTPHDISVTPGTLSLNFALQPDQRPVLWGGFDHINGLAAHALVRLNIDGSLDSTYGKGLPPETQVVVSAAMDSSGSLYAERWDFLYEPFPMYSNSLVRLTPDGQLDPAFHADTSVTSYDPSYVPPYSVVLQTNAPVIYRNSAQDVVNGKPMLVRLNLDGTQDPAFVGVDFCVGRVEGESVLVGDLQILTALTNGVIIGAIGIPNDINPAAPMFYDLYVLNPDGSVRFSGPGSPGRVAPWPNSHGVLDPWSGGYYLPAGYEPAPGSSPFTCFLQLPDGSFLVAGNFSRFAETNVGGLARLFSNGSLDTSFATLGAGAAYSGNPALPAQVHKVILAGNDKVWVTGDFDIFNGTPCPGIARLNFDGSVDPTFSCDLEYYPFTGDDTDIALCSNGDLLVRGTFRSAGDTWPYALTRLTQHPPLIIQTTGVSNGFFGIRIENPAPGSVVVIEASTDLLSWAPVFTNSAASISFAEDISSHNRRFYRAASQGGPAAAWLGQNHPINN
jgi:uncharacterized delta-60 repeat protein